MFNEKILNENILNYLDIKILLNDLILIFKHIIISSFKYPIIIFVTASLLIIIWKKLKEIIFFIVFLF